jgi:hypothetical protein
MKKWMPLRGDFVEDNESVVFQGIPQQSPDNRTPNSFLAGQVAREGIILFEDVLANGVIKATVEFEEFDKGDIAQIVFNYQSDLAYMSAGVSNAQAKYVFNLTNGQMNTICAAGFVENLPTTKFDMNLQIIGSFLGLYINGIRVLTSAIPLLVSQTQVGIWVKSRKNVMIKDFTAICKQPEVFIVSQFGGDYDILYDEVIKPVCIKLHYDPIRGDEVASCSMILSDIITSIQNSAVIIADITPDNPNVFYEIGYAHALKKPTILLCDKALRDRLPFDVSGFRTIFYDNSIGGKRRVEEKLEVYLQNINNSLGVAGGSIV